MSESPTTPTDAPTAPTATAPTATAPTATAPTATAPSTPAAPNARAEFLSVLEGARHVLSRYGAAHVVMAGLAGLGVGCGVSLLLVGAVQFTLALRIALNAVVVLCAVGAVLWAVLALLRPLRFDVVVAARLQDALTRQGVFVGDQVRGAVELLKPDDRASAALVDAHLASTTARIRQGDAHASLFGVALERAVPTLIALACTVGALGAWWVVAPQSLHARALLLWSPQAAKRAVEVAAASAVPLVSDLTVTLRYPAYMALADEVFAGSSGDISAARGTEVTVSGRADRGLAAAAVVVGDKELAAVVSAGTAVRASFTVDSDGSYRFKITNTRGASTLDPAAHKITVVADNVPTVSFDAPDADATLKQDAALALAFHASDDFGVSRFAVEVRRQGNARTPWMQDLLSVKTALREARGTGTVAIKDTGARPGDKLSVTILAYDNDTISGPKPGRSQTRVITVFSAAEQHDTLIARLQELLDKMTDSLADELDAPIVSGEGNDLTAAVALLAKHTTAQLHHDVTLSALTDAVLVLAQDELAPDGMRRALANLKLGEMKAHDAKRASMRIAHASVDAGRVAPAAVWRRAAQDQITLVERMEKDAVYLDDLLAQQRVSQAQQIAADLVNAQKDLRELMKEFKASGDEKARQQILDEIKRMREQMQQLAAKLAELQKDIPDEYLNEEAFKGDEMMQQAKDIDQLLEEGKLDEAQKALEEMIDGTQKLVDELQKTGEDMGGDNYKELREKLDRFSQDLKALQQGQREVLAQSEQLLDKSQREFAQKQGAKLKAALQELKKKVERAQTALKGVDQDALFGHEAEDTETAKARADDLDAALESEDLQDALQNAAEAVEAAAMAEMSVADRSRGRFGARDPQTAAAKSDLAQAHAALDDVKDKLLELMPDPSSALDAAAKQKLARGADQQDQLQEGAQRLRQLMQEIDGEAPVFGPEHKRQIDEARALMERASQQMKSKNLRGARSAQRQAGQRLADLQKALEEQSQQQGQQGQGGMPMPLPGGGSPGSVPQRDGADGRKNAQDEVKIPDANAFKVPDAYRKDIIDAMREGAPPSFSEEVKRYYEELVK